MSKIGHVSQWYKRLYSRILREPVDTISNLEFICIGLFILYIVRTDGHKVTQQSDFVGISSISTLCASNVMFLGPGPMLMHGTNTAWGEWAENLSWLCIF